jgi:hypothetical protein
MIFLNIHYKDDTRKHATFKRKRGQTTMADIFKNYIKHLRTSHVIISSFDFTLMKCEIELSQKFFIKHILATTTQSLFKYKKAKATDTKSNTDERPISQPII